MFQILEDDSPLIQEASCVLTNWRGVAVLFISVWVCPQAIAYDTAPRICLGSCKYNTYVDICSLLVNSKPPHHHKHLIYCPSLWVTAEPNIVGSWATR